MRETKFAGVSRKHVEDSFFPIMIQFWAILAHTAFVSTARSSFDLGLKQLDALRFGAMQAKRTFAAFM